MFTQDFFVNGKFAGSSERGMWKVQTTFRPPPSSLFFCRRCGVEFARVLVRDREGKIQEWEALSCICERCGDGDCFTIPGSILKIWDHAFVETLPLELLKREFHLTLKHKTGVGLWT